MAQLARRSERSDHVPPYDPTAVERAYAAHRARREARLRRKRARRSARVRFGVIMLTLLALATVLGVAVWREIERLFVL